MKRVPLSDEPQRVLYQIYLESFQDEALGDGCGDFAGLKKRLDYLQKLGVGGILLMPITDSDGQGYITQDFFALRKDYGGSADLKKREEAFVSAVAAAHKRNIKVFIDLTLNHMSRDSKWFQQSAKRVAGYKDFFVWSKTPKRGWRLPWFQDSKA